MESVNRRREHRAGMIISFFEWSLLVPEPKTGKLDFNRYPFQRELYDTPGAMAKEAVVKKATQVGVSTYLLRWVMWHCDVRATDSLYVFPKRQQMYDFSDARVKAAILASPYLSKRIPVGDVNNKGLKKIGRGHLYARGSESKHDLDAVPADILALDEYDTLRQENIPDAERRISGSLDGKTRRVGVPSIPGYGIDRAFNRTDQRFWMVKCERCGEQQTPSYANIEEGTPVNDEWPDAHLVCTKCRKPLDVLGGEWVAKHPDRLVRGYHMPRLIVAHADIPTIVAAHYKTNAYERQVHFNKDLAEAWAPAEGRLTDAAIEAATRDLPAIADPYSGGSLVTGGVDVATTRNLNVRISLHHEPKRKGGGDPYKTPLFVGEVESFGQVGELMDRYSVNILCIDHLPEGRLARQLAERFPGRIYLARFGTHNEVMKVEPEMRAVSVQRTPAIDATFDAIRQQRNLLPSPETRPTDYVEQLQALTRVQEENEKGQMKVEYVNGGQPFDHAMAEVYDMLAKEVFLWQTGVNELEQGETMSFEEMYDFERTELDRGTVQLESKVDVYEPGFDQ